MLMEPMPIPYPLNRYRCHVWCPVLVVLDIHGHDADTMSGILDTHAADTMNQIPMVIILMPCVVSCSGGTRYRCRVWHLLEVTGIYAADNHEPDAYATDAVCGVLWR